MALCTATAARTAQEKHITMQYYTVYDHQEIPCEVVKQGTHEWLLEIMSPVLKHPVFINREPRLVKLGRAVVINTCVGGFGVSNHALNWIAARKQWPNRTETGIAELELHLRQHRDDPDLVAAVNELGSTAASGTYAELKIAWIPPSIGWHVTDYWAGAEEVHESHRTWR
jgi:hypothetical protein